MKRLLILLLAVILLVAPCVLAGHQVVGNHHTNIYCECTDPNANWVCVDDDTGEELPPCDDPGFVAGRSGHKK